MGTCPDEPRAFFMQQYRWCMGSTTLLMNREFWGSSLTKMQKLCYLSGMFYYSATAVVSQERARGGREWRGRGTERGRRAP